MPCTRIMPACAGAASVARTGNTGSTPTSRRRRSTSTMRDAADLAATHQPRLWYPAWRRHADGKYPGATDQANAYAEIHDPAVDLAVIGDALAAYRGELTILSDNLREALRR